MIYNALTLFLSWSLWVNIQEAQFKIRSSSLVIIHEQLLITNGFSFQSGCAYICDVLKSKFHPSCKVLHWLQCLEWLLLIVCSFIYGIRKEVDQFLRFFNFQVLSRLSELETTLEAGLRHRDAALNSIGFQLTKWMNMVRFLCLISPVFKLIWLNPFTWLTLSR